MLKINDINGIKIEPKINLTFGKSGKNNQGGDGGSIMIISEEFRGSGLITADGGDGEIAGKGGNINIHTKRNQFKGIVSAKGGSLRK